MRHDVEGEECKKAKFPFLLGGTFIEAEQEEKEFVGQIVDFPSFWEGLSLRRDGGPVCRFHAGKFPFLLGGTFIEAHDYPRREIIYSANFPSFWEGLSLRQ